MGFLQFPFQIFPTNLLRLLRSLCNRLLPNMVKYWIIFEQQVSKIFHYIAPVRQLIYFIVLHTVTVSPYFFANRKWEKDHFHHTAKAPSLYLLVSKLKLSRDYKLLCWVKGLWNRHKRPRGLYDGADISLNTSATVTCDVVAVFLSTPRHDKTELWKSYARRMHEWHWLVKYQHSIGITQERDMLLLVILSSLGATYSSLTQNL